MTLGSVLLVCAQISFENKVKMSVLPPVHRWSRVFFEVSENSSIRRTSLWVRVVSELNSVDVYWTLPCSLEILKTRARRW